MEVRKLFKKILASGLSLVLVFSVVGVIAAKEESRLQEVSEKYSVGEVISEADLEIIKAESYKVEVSDIKPQDYKEWRVFGSARNSDRSVEIDIAGNTVTDLGLINNNISGTLTTKTVRGAGITQSGVDYTFKGWGVSIGFL